MTRRIIIMSLLGLAVPTAVSATTAGPDRYPDLSGTWARAQVTTALVDIPLVGELASRTLAVTLLRVEQKGVEVTLEEEVCRLTTKAPTSLVSTQYPEAFIRAVSGNRRRGRLEWDGATFRYREPKQAYWRGMRPDVDVTEPLPTEPDDPRIRDLDNDGQPGLTVKVEGLISGEIFLVQRSWSELNGTIRSNSRIEGQVAWGSEEQILGATRSMLKSKPKKRPDPAQSGNFFRMRRVPASATCEQVMARRRRLLGL